MPTLDPALLCSSRAGADLGQTSDRFEELIPLKFAAFILFPQYPQNPIFGISLQRKTTLPFWIFEKNSKWLVVISNFERSIS